MKKIINYLIALLCVLFVSCTSPAQTIYSDGVVYDGITYYDYYMDNFYYENTPVIYINGSYFLQYWDIARSMWYRRPMPAEWIPSIRMNFWHNHYLGGRWIGSYEDRFRFPRTGSRMRDGGFRSPNQPGQRSIPMPGRDRRPSTGRSRTSGTGFGHPGNNSPSRGSISGSSRGHSSRSNSGGARTGGPSAPARAATHRGGR